MATASSKKQHPSGKEQAVRERYSAAAEASEAALCCPVSYNPRYLKAIPAEILEKDYGCGDPTPFVLRGETVLDLGCGGGKLCYIAAQIVGPQGRVIGVDCNPDMLALARKYQSQMAETLGCANTEFHCGRIQDLKLNLERLTARWGSRPLANSGDWLALQDLEATLRRDEPLIEDESVDVVISNCVLNLVDPLDRQRLFQEIYRVLKVGGRAAISDIVSDADVPESMQQDSRLWSGCISGAWREDRFLEEFTGAGFQGAHIARLEAQPWQVVQGIEFRSMTVVATKTAAGICLERNQAVIYRGPFASVLDDDGHRYVRGQRTAVCHRTFDTLMSEPYRGQFIAVEPKRSVPLEAAAEFDCSVDQLRDPRVTRGGLVNLNSSSNADGCGGEECC
jgi:SAM-dependent methyltransferase